MIPIRKLLTVNNSCASNLPVFLGKEVALVILVLLIC